KDILASLRFDDMHLRASRIVETTASTCELIFKGNGSGHHAVRCTQWLEYDDDIYCVSGKAGSGKSTLLKHIATQPLSKAGLQSWSKGRRLFTASHYSWNLGTPMQKSYQGLLSSILYDVLRPNPGLVEHACESGWQDGVTGRDRRDTPRTLSDLRLSIDELAVRHIDADGASLCFCFVVDGLDEYAGHHEEDVRLLCRLSEADNIKICTSSRPWEVFQQFFVTSPKASHCPTICLCGLLAR
ncbi:hypothetical protein DOTSEDRAFT_133380, partial [Dothistroma septosporum NZE10]